MSRSREPHALLERIRDLEVELASCRVELARRAESDASSSVALLEVTTGDRRFLVPVDSIREVVPIARPTPLAGSPPWVMGTVPYGSRTVPLVDLGRRLGGPATGLAPALQLVVLDSPTWLGLVVEGVGRVLEVAVGRLQGPPAEVPSARFLVAAYRDADGETLLVLSPARLAGTDDA